MKEKGDPTQEEFRIVYALEGSIDLSTRHFMAFSPEEAMSMFEFVSKKIASWLLSKKLKNGIVGIPVGKFRI